MIGDISSNNARLLKPKREHDWHSLAEVMRLFRPKDVGNAENWTHLCDDVRLGPVNESEISDYPIELIDKGIPLQATRDTRVEKQPVQPVFSSRGTTKRARLVQSY